MRRAGRYSGLEGRAVHFVDETDFAAGHRRQMSPFRHSRVSAFHAAASPPHIAYPPTPRYISRMPKPQKIEVDDELLLRVKVVRVDDDPRGFPTVTVQMPNGHRETILQDSQSIEEIRKGR